jgi:hypothetical protein
MIGRRGFQIEETRRASSGSVRVRWPLPGENHSAPVGQDRRRPCEMLPQHERAPPTELARVAGAPTTIADPAPDMALGQRRRR